MTSIGQREACSRIAHLLCEMLMRLRAVGLANGYSCKWPITEGEIGDALGITRVHVNRVLQAMQADGLIELKGERLTIPDWDRLKEAGNFEPTYLHPSARDGSILEPASVGCNGHWDSAAGSYPPQLLGDALGTDWITCRKGFLDRFVKQLLLALLQVFPRHTITWRALRGHIRLGLPGVGLFIGFVFHARLSCQNTHLGLQLS
jgi:hypothetical protein